MESSEAGAVLLSATSAISAFTALLPDFADVRKSVGDVDMTNDVRMGEFAATGTAVAVGLIASSVTKSPAPAIAAIAVAVGLIFMYESVLRSVPTPDVIAPSVPPVLKSVPTDKAATDA